MADLYSIFKIYNKESWILPISDHIFNRYQEIEKCMQDTFQYVTPDKSNRHSHSPMFSRIIKDIGSTFGSTLKELINLVTQTIIVKISMDT